MKSRRKHVVLGVTGSIAAYKAGDLIRRLQDKGFDVSVVMTKEAERFVTPLTLAGLSGRPVYRDFFQDQEHDWEMSHIRLAEEADVFLIAPATANVIGKLACGLADDLLSCAAMTTRAPLLIAPAMNEAMYLNPAVQENCQRLKKRKVRFIEPHKGKLACGTFGTGHLAEIDAIVRRVQSAAH